MIRQRAFAFACVGLVLTSLLATGCFQSLFPDVIISETAVVIPVSTPTSPMDSPTASVTAEGAFVLPPPVFASFEIDPGTLELSEYALGLTTQDLNNGDVLAPVYTILNSNRWQPARTSASDETPLEEAKRALNAWGYHCENNALYHDQQFLIQSLACDEREASFTRSGTDFVWFLPVRSRAEGWLVRRDQIDQYWDQQLHFWVKPKYVGDDLLIVVDVFGDGGHELRVEMNGQTVYTQALQGPGDCLGTGLYVWGDKHWGLNTEGDVVIDGERLGRQQGYTEAYGLHLLKGKPVYFVAQRQVIKMILNGQVVH